MTIATKMNRLVEPFELPTMLEDTCKLKGRLYKYCHDLILYCQLNQATNYKERKEAFIALYKLTFGSKEKAAAFFEQKDETKQMMF